MTNKRASQAESSVARQHASRLEHVRTAMGDPDVKAFHQRLASGWTNPVGYRAALNYHNVEHPRAAPARYLSRVAEVCGVLPAYLLTGEEPVFREDAERWEIEGELAAAQDEWEKQRMEAFWSAFPPLKRMPLQVRHFFLEVWSSYNNTGWFYPPVRGYLNPEIGRRIHDLLMAPFGRAGRPEIMSAEFADYASAMLLALNLAVRVPFTPPKEPAQDP